MRIFFDQGTPLPLRRHLTKHEVATAAGMAWSQLTNGELLAAASEAGFELLLTTDQNLRQQQNLKNRAIAIVVLTSISWPRIAKKVSNVVDAIDAIGVGDYFELIFEPRLAGVALLRRWGIAPWIRGGGVGPWG